MTEAEIDQSTKIPVLFFLGWGIFWLLFTSFFGLLASLKIHWPGFLGGIEYLTYGRIQAVFLNSFMYGWASCSVFAIGLWMMSRLSQVRLRHGSFLVVAGVFWNLTVLLGLVGILLGETTGFRALEMPSFTAPVLLLSYSLVMVWGVFTFYARQTSNTYTSQWYLLGGFFWFPWVFSVAQALLVWAPVRGTVQSVVNAWYVYNFFALWLVPLALAAIYYFLPKILGRPIRYHYLAVVGFWAYAVIAPWCGVAVLSGGPVPAWISTAGIVAMTMLLIPITVIGVNFLATLSGVYQKARASTTLTFILVGIFAFLAFHVVQAFLAYRNFQEIFQFTHVNSAMWTLGMYAFFSMTVFGAVYFVLPRVMGREWILPGIMKMHFWCSLLGVLLIVVSLGIAGWVQGVQMNDPAIPFVDVVRASSHWLVGASLGWMLLLVGHVAFAINILFLGSSRTISDESRSVLVSTPPELKMQTT